jgi:hypothetical protein
VLLDQGFARVTQRTPLPFGDDRGDGSAEAERGLDSVQSGQPTLGGQPFPLKQTFERRRAGPLKRKIDLATWLMRAPHGLELDLLLSPWFCSTLSAEQHRVDDHVAIVDPAEVESRSRDRNVSITREEIELAQHRRSGHVQRAAKWRAIGLVGMTGEDADDPIPVAGDDRFQSCCLLHDERREVVRWSRQATGVVEHDEVSLWSRIT